MVLFAYYAFGVIVSASAIGVAMYWSYDWEPVVYDDEEY